MEKGRIHEFKKWAGRGVRAAGIALILGGGALLYQQNTELRTQNQALKGEVNFLGNELFETDGAACNLADFIGQATGMGGVDCNKSMQDEFQRFENNGIQLPLPTKPLQSS